MFCMQCGASLPTAASFCQDCGAPVPETRPPAADAASTSGPQAISENADGRDLLVDDGPPEWPICPACQRANWPGASVCACGSPIGKIRKLPTLDAALGYLGAEKAAQEGVPLRSARRQEPVTRPFADIPIWKVVLLFIATSGLYVVVWFYRQWKAVRKASGRGLWPVPRAIFSPFFVFPLFKLIEQAQPAGSSFPGQAIAIAWLTLVIAPATINQFWTSSFFPWQHEGWWWWQVAVFAAFVGFLVMAQRAASRANVVLAGRNSQPPERFSFVTGLAVTAGAINWALSFWLVMSASTLIAWLMASDANRGLPRKVDEITELTRVSAEAGRLVYDYTVLQRWRRSLLVAKIREKFRTDYVDFTDEELQQRVMAKYPGEYDDLAKEPAPLEDRPEERHLGKQNVAAIAPETVFGPEFDTRIRAWSCSDAGIRASTKLGITYIYCYTSADGVPLRAVEISNVACRR